MQNVTLIKMSLDGNGTTNGKKRRARQHYSAETVSRLNEHFRADPSPNQYRLEQLSEELGLDYRSVRVWFCNKRQATKNLAK